jgi:hypothetical protein
MSIAVICCQVLEKEIRAVVGAAPAVEHLEVMEWGLHTRPDLLVEALSERIRIVQDRVDAVFLGYGRCQTLDKLPRDFKVPVVYPEGEDCIGVLLGQDRYEDELFREAFTWFLTPGWAAMGIEFVFRELQLHGMAEKGIDPLQMAHRMLKDYRRALLIEMETENSESLLRKGQEFAEEFHMRLERTSGSLSALERAFSRALRHCSQATR